MLGQVRQLYVQLHLLIRLWLNEGKIMARDKRIEVRVDNVEYDEINKRSSSCSMTMSQYLRAAAMSVKIESTIDAQAIVELGRINADLSRLGNLMKLTLDTAYDNYNEETIKNINELINDLRSTQNILREVFLAL